MTIEKLNKEYKPLSVAVFLAIGGLLSGTLLGSFFVENPAGMVREWRVSGGSSLIPQAEGAEIDSAALTPQNAPSLVSANIGASSARPVEDVDMLYNRGAIGDFAPITKTKPISSVNGGKKISLSGTIYQVATGDTIQSISAMSGVPINTIIEFNPSVNFSSLVPGTPLAIPGQNDITALSAGN